MLWCVMVEIKNNELIFFFPEVNDHAVLGVHFRTVVSPKAMVRLVPHPEDGWVLATVGPVIMQLRPRFAAEHNWPGSSEPGLGDRYPFAVLVSVGGLNALTGEPSRVLLRTPQNYFSSPPQGGIDGYFVDGQVHPFRAGAEPDLNNTRLEIKAFPMKKEAWDFFMFRRGLIPGPGPFITGLTLKHGGERQCEPVYEDLCGIGDWDRKREETVTVWLKGRS
jgi:hypothetical protein